MSVPAESSLPQVTPAVDLLLQWTKSQPGLITPSKLAKILGYKPSQITYWFNKGGNPDLDALQQIAERTKAWDLRHPPPPGASYLFGVPGIPLEHLLAARGLRIKSAESFLHYIEEMIQHTDLLPTRSAKGQAVQDLRQAWLRFQDLDDPAAGDVELDHTIQRSSA